MRFNSGFKGLRSDYFLKRNYLLVVVKGTHIVLCEIWAVFENIIWVKFKIHILIPACFLSSHFILPCFWAPSRYFSPVFPSVPSLLPSSLCASLLLSCDDRQSVFYLTHYFHCAATKYSWGHAVDVSRSCNSDKLMTAVQRPHSEVSDVIIQ